MAVTGVSAVKAVTSHTSPTFLKTLVGDIAGLKDARRLQDAKMHNLRERLGELQREPVGEEGVAEELRKVRAEIRALEQRRRADAALLAHKEEQLEAIRKGQVPKAVDDDAKRRAEAEAAGNPYAALVTTDLSSLNES